MEQSSNNNAALREWQRYVTWMIYFTQIILVLGLGRLAIEHACLWQQVQSLEKNQVIRLSGNEDLQQIKP